MMKKLLNFIGRRDRWAWPHIAVMLFLVVLPLILIMGYAFTDAEGSFTLHNFVKFFTNSDAVNTFVYSLGIALMTTMICILLGYPAAYFMAGKQFSTPKVMAMLFILPMWINVLLRTLATVALFDFLHIALDEKALMFGMVYDFLPFMIYPIYNTLQKMDNSLPEAAADLGASPLKVFLRVTLPLSMPGVKSGIIMVFMPTISTFAIAELLTQNNIKLFGTVIQENVNNGLLNYGAALSLIMLVIIAITSFGGEKDNESSQLF
ncbi:MAG: ABC transporter permease [Bacteroidales bacterium]|nr:ABC transporter permease [Candidatus Sodaliphilus aphodohippi]